MIGHHDAVDADFQAGPNIPLVLHALENDGSFPELPDHLDPLPGYPVHVEARQEGRQPLVGILSIGKQVDEIRLTVNQGADRPDRVGGRLPDDPGRELERQLEAVLEFTVAFCPHGNVQRHHERLVSGRLRTVDQILHGIHVLGHIQLEPADIRRRTGDFLEQRGAEGTEDIGDVRLLTRSCQGNLRTRPHHIPKAHRRDADGHGIAVTEYLDGLVGAGNIPQVTGGQFNVVPGFAVPAFAVLLVNAAVHIVIGESRNSSLRPGFQIGDGGVSGVVFQVHAAPRSCFLLCRLMRSRKLAASAAADSANPLSLPAYRTEREELMIRPCPLLSIPASTTAAISPP